MSLYILLAYLLILLLVSVFSFRKGFLNIFRTEKSLPWFLAGFSVFMINPDTINILSKMGIAATEGYSGLWIFYTGVLGAGFLPILFAPLWSRLKFMTDNQFILFRFSGRSARILHLFRAVYVGYLVVALFIAQVFIALSKLLVIFFDISYGRSFLVIGLILAGLIAKNSLRIKVRTDLLNGILYLAAFALGGFFVLRYFGGIGEIYPALRSDYTEYIRLFPDGWDRTTFGSLPTVLIYFFVQWWSINVLDGAGPEAQRFMNTKGPYQAFKAAFLPVILLSIIFLAHSFVIDAGILMVHESARMIPEINGNPDLEAGFIHLYKQAMPGGLSTLVFLAFFAGLISFLESFVNWGSSFVVVDVFKTYLIKEREERIYSVLSYSVMALIGVSGMLIAWYNTHLLGLQKFIFSMGAGVGPVFILRWFWWRINAWSQLTAMLSSLILAVGWDLLNSYSTGFQQFVDTAAEILNMSSYAWKLLCLTFLVSGAWLSVTFLTRPDDEATLKAYAEKVRPGRFRILHKHPEHSETDHPKRLMKWRRLLLLLAYPAVSLLPFLIIWQFKFGSVSLAVAGFISWILLMILTVRGMSQTEN